MNFIFTILVLLAVVIAIVLSWLVIVPQGFAYVIESLGRYKATWGPGPHIKIPVLERVAKKVNVKEQVGDFAAIEAITKDNVMIQVDSVVFYKVRSEDPNPRKYAYGVTNPEEAIEMLAATTLRNVVGEMTLDEALTSRERINESMRQVLDDATDDWGVLVRRVEIKSLKPNNDVRIAMEKQVTAERNKRAEILEAEGHKQSDILKAEGHKQALILDAEADKQKKILEAEAERQALIDRAMGQAEAIERVHKAQAIGLRYLKEAGADETVIKLKSLEALEKVADGNATKLIIPSELTGAASIATAVTESAGVAMRNAKTKEKPAKEKEFKIDEEPEEIRKREEEIKQW